MVESQVNKYAHMFSVMCKQLVFKKLLKIKRTSYCDE